MSDERFNEPLEEGQWTFREAAEHLAGLKQHALKTMRKDGALR